MVFKWSEAYSVDNTVIDKHHRHLFDLFNKFNDALSSDNNESIVHDILLEIKDYTVYHFSYEEEAMKTSRCPDYEMHKQNHDDFIIEVDNLISNNDTHQCLEKGAKTYKLLLVWLQNHILQVDQHYKPYFKN